MITNYIEFDSTYRDRTQWPLPSEFEVLLSQSGRKSQLDAVDPVSTSTPITSWTSNNINANTQGTQLTGVIDSISGGNNIAGINRNDIFVITSSSGNLQHQEDYYKKLVFINTTIGERKMIDSYEYIGTDSGGTNDRAIVSFETKFGNTMSNGDAWEINDPSDVSNTSYPLFFVPNGRSGRNAYSGSILYNETLKQYRKITEYNSLTHVLRIETPNNPVVNWLTTHNYSIRKQKPLLNTNTTTVVSGNASNIVISGASSINNIYNGQFLRIQASSYGNNVVPPENESRRIISYDGGTATVRVSPPFSASPTAGSFIEIMSFSYDNLNPFTYSGSQLSHQEMVCYEIKMLNLTLPNKVLKTELGSRIAFYPYVYVELSNISGANAGSKNLIYSNNPNSTRMIFRSAINDISNSERTAFVKLSGDDAGQILKFKPNDNLKFAVYLSNGELYQTIDPEYYSPSSPNQEIQISVLFSIKRL